MKHQALFASKDISKKIKVSSAAILLGALRVKVSLLPYLYGDIKGSKNRAIRAIST